MSDQTTCSRCGKPAARRERMGLCPDCLLAAGLGSVADATAAGPAARFVPPEASEIAPLFPQLEITGLLGCGGMGAVYKARQRNLDRLVALKILPPDIGRDPAFAERFAREARALAKLNHPNIVTLYEFGQAGELFYFLMEFVDGVNLRQLIRDGRVAPREALAIVPQLCDALQYAHDAGIVHRDIKPENILLDRKGRVKVADFGLAKLVGFSAPTERAEPSDPSDPCHETTHASLVLGTPAYMAPEQRERPSGVDHRADIYSLGVVFYQMLTGELPGVKIEPPSKRVEVDVRLDEVVLRALEKKPELRYQQVGDVKTLLETIAKGPAAPEAASVAVGGWGAGGLSAAVFCILYLALVALLARTAHLLPDLVASHFGVGGAADGWMSRSGYLLFVAGFPLVIGLVLAGVSVMVGTLPACLINIPRKDFWLIPERRALTVRIIRNWLTWLLSLMTLFFAGLHVLTVEANRCVPAQLPMGGLLLVVMGFLMALMIWVILLLMKFAETGAATLPPRVRAGVETSASTPQAPALSLSDVKRTVRGPATGLLITALLSPFLPGIMTAAGRLKVGAWMLWPLIYVLVGTGVAAYGAIRMKRLESYRSALAGSIAGCLISFFNLLCLPFSVWSLAVLTRNSVREGFRQAAGAAFLPTDLPARRTVPSGAAVFLAVVVSGVLAALFLADREYTLRERAAARDVERAAPASATHPFEVRLVQAAWTLESEERTWQPRPGETERLHLRKGALLDETDVQAARVVTNQQGRLELALTFTPAGAARFAEATRLHAGQRLAMLLNGRVYAVPHVREPVQGSQCSITGDFEPEEARRLAAAVLGARKESR